MLFKDRKAQVGIIGAIMLFMVFLVLFFLFLGSFVNTVTHNAVSDAELTGIEAFLLHNFVFIILIIMLLSMMGWMMFGGGL